MPIVAYRVAGPVLKWMVTMTSIRLSPLTLERVRFPVYADSAGAPYDPTGATVQAAFMGGDGYESGDDPAPGDWKAATWDTTVTGNYVAGCLVGPGGAAVLDVGSYSCWVKITDATAGETVVRQVGTLIVE